MSPSRTLLQPVRPVRCWPFCLSAVVAGVLALSVHVVLRRVFDVPDPTGFLADEMEHHLAQTG